VGDADVFSLSVDDAGDEVVEFFLVGEDDVCSCVVVFSVVNVDGFVDSKTTNIFDVWVED